MRPEPLLLGRTRDLPVPVHSASLRARVFDLAGPLSASRFRRSRCCLPHIARASASRSNEFSRLNCPARTFPCQRFSPSLAACAPSLEVSVVRHSFPVLLFHSLRHAGLPALSAI